MFQQPENCVTFVCAVLMCVLGINTFIVVCASDLLTCSLIVELTEHLMCYSVDFNRT